MAVPRCPVPAVEGLPPVVSVVLRPVAEIAEMSPPERNKLNPWANELTLGRALAFCATCGQIMLTEWLARPVGPH